MAGIRWLRSHAHVVLPTAVVATAVVTLLASVGHPPRIFFDEVYYVNDARDFLEFGVEDGFVVHPPLGKMIIALSIWLFGDTPFGWRALGGIAGVAGAVLVHAIARRLGLRRSAAALAGIALALDGVWIAQAHTAMLDIHLGFLVVLGTWLVVRDRDHVRAVDEAALAGAADARSQVSLAAESPEPLRLERLPRARRWWLVAAGVAFGAAVAVKWSGVLALLAAGAVVAGGEVARRRNLLGSWRRQLGPVVGLVTVLGLVAVATYFVAWTPWVVSFDDTWVASARCATAGSEGSEGSQGALDCDDIDGRVRALQVFHGEMIDFHLDLDADHAYRAPATGWPIQKRPVVYYYETCGDDRRERVPETDSDGNVTVPEPCSVPQGSAAEIISLGNPAVWWTLVALLPVAGALLRRRERGSWLVAAFIAFQFVPWLLGPSRPVFNFYNVPIVPFVVLALAAAVDHLASHRRAWLPLGVGLVAGGLVAAGAQAAAVAGWTTIDWTSAWYVVGMVGLVAGAITAAPRSGRPSAEAPAFGDTAHRVWPAAVVGAAVVGVGVWFLPLWWGVTLPEGVVRAHYWLRSWI